MTLYSNIMTGFAEKPSRGAEPKHEVAVKRIIMVHRDVLCKECRGTGVVEDGYTCDICNGSGRVTETRKAE